ncbi:MAG: leucyl/phenylalanyl-tRNA--protein transferase [Pseudomonadota bacterium]
MKDAESPAPPLTPGLLLRAYAAGVFPMAEAASSEEIFWVDPRRRGILPLDGFHLSRSLKKRLLRAEHEVRIDTDFEAVLEGCADREETWINPVIRDLYVELHRTGHAHSIEVWQGDILIGGLYGVRLRSAFFGESMFSRAADGSKIALAYLIARLRHGGFTLLDTQFTTPHLESMGAVAVPRLRYHALLRAALDRPAEFYSLPDTASPAAVVHAINQTS